MKKMLLSLLLISLFSCQETKEQVVEEAQIMEEKTDSLKFDVVRKEANELKKKGFQTFTYDEKDTTYLMQQYFIVFLKKGPNRSQDSTETANLQKKHMEHLSWLYKKGYTSLTGPLGDDSEISGIVIFNTPTQKEADSLANMDPMVKAGRLVVESHPWWVAKGGKLK